MAASNDQLSSQVSEALAQLGSITETLGAASESLASNAPARFKILGALKGAAEAIKQPQDTIMELLPVFVQPPVIRLFIKWNAFALIPQEGTISYGELASKLDADVDLITRLCWILVATGVLKQIGEDQVTHTRNSLLYIGLNPISALMSIGVDDHLTSLCVLAKYFEAYGRKEPTGRQHTIFSYANGQPESTVWDILARDPERQANHMAAMSSMLASWPILSPYDLSWVVPHVEASPDRTLVVDVGGGKGHCLKAIVKSTPGLPMARCALEDIPAVIESVKESDDKELEGATLLSMDFHAEQPIKGALVYYIRRCLHDYGDADSIDILQQIVGAMADDSRLLIVEQVMTNPPSVIAASADIVMATIGGKERTIGNFERLAAAVGLKINQVIPNPGSEAAIIECVKA